MNKNKVIRDLIDRNWEEFVIHITAAVQQLDDVHIAVSSFKENLKHTFTPISNRG